MFAAMHPSGPVAHQLRTLRSSSLLPLSVAGPVHGRPFFSTGAVLQIVAVEGALCSGVGHSHSSNG